jgi:hypothetical protein
MAAPGLRRLQGEVAAQTLPAEVCLAIAGGPQGPWTRLAPRGQGQVHLFLAEPLTAPADLLVLTRGPALIGPIQGFADG